MTRIRRMHAAAWLALMVAATGGTQPTWLSEAAAAERETIELARKSFGSSGLSYPDVEIRFHMDRADCEGHDGFYRPRASAPDLIDVCYDRSDLEHGHVTRARMLWHELGHAYVEATIDDATRGEVLERLDVGAWDRGDWGGQGGEKAAEILVWGMRGGRYRINRGVGQIDCDVMETVYEMLTGLPAPAC